MVPPASYDFLMVAAVPDRGMTAPDLAFEVTAAPPTVAIVIAQADDADVLGDIAGAFKTFIDSGQVWALLVGLIAGYVVRGITTYK